VTRRTSDLEQACDAVIASLGTTWGPKASANALAIVMVETMRQLGFSRAEVIEFVAAHYDQNIESLKRERGTQ
jgi:Holliday junction resolvasome RuvABC DNA-binding subunit